MLNRIPLAVGGLAALLLVASPALAQHAAKHDKASKAKEADEGVPEGAAGQTAAVDAASGKLRPVTPEEARELIAGMARMVDQSSEDLKPVYHPNGMVSVDLEDRFQSVSMARVGTDGSVKARCVDTVREAEQFLGLQAGVKAGKPAVGKRAAGQPTKGAAPARAVPPAPPLEEK